MRELRGARLEEVEEETAVRARRGLDGEWGGAS